MKHLIFLVVVVCSFTIAYPQEYSSASIFAHNDYVQPKPFFAAYELKVGYIEADIFLHKDKLIVAHTRIEIKNENTLESLYLDALDKQIKVNNGQAYTEAGKRLALMIDLKSKGVSTLNRLVEVLKKYPDLIACKTLDITVSGDMPDPSSWKDFPSFIHFDGRPGVNYTDEQLERITLISTSFKSHCNWNGKTSLSAGDRNKVIQLRDEVHSKGKKLRFWAIPDFDNGWKTLMELNIDIIGTDQVADLHAFISTNKMH